MKLFHCVLTTLAWIAGAALLVALIAGVFIGALALTSWLL